jgi:lysophospholipase L1-like esterase
VTIQDNTGSSAVIIDNDGPGTSYSGGGWGYSSGADPYNGSSRAESVDGATYTFQAPVSGYYTISLWWTWWPSRCSSVPVSIYRGNQFLSTVLVDQQEPGLAGQWNGIGAFAFTGNARVVIRAQNGCSASADAVRFQLQEGIDNYYVAIGDSITDGFGDNDPSDDISQDGRNSAGGFEPILNDFLTATTGKSHTIVNEGVGGATSSNGLASINTILDAHPESWRFLVQYGTNDANPWLPTPSGKGLSSGDAGYPGTFKDNMQQIVDAINAAGKEVCLAKLPIILGDSTFGTPYTDPDIGVRNTLIKEYNDVIDELKNNPLNNITITPPDFYSLFNEDVSGGKRYDFEYADNLHPNGEGYISVAGGWLEALTP